MMTYEQIEKDSKKIVSSISMSKREIPAFFSMFGKVKIHFIVYWTFAVLSYFSLPSSSGLGLWVFFVFFGFFHWFVISSFVASYANMFAMLDKDMLNSFELSRVIGKKVKDYGIIWLAFIFLFGAASVATEWSILPLVIGNFIITFFMFFIFNMDISRYQLAGLFGAIKAAKEKLSQ